MTDEENVVDFSQASEKHRHEKTHQEKEEKVEHMRARFAKALPDKPRPVREYLRRKRSKKKR